MLTVHYTSSFLLSFLSALYSGLLVSSAAEDERGRTGRGLEAGKRHSYLMSNYSAPVASCHTPDAPLLAPRIFTVILRVYLHDARR